METLIKSRQTSRSFHRMQAACPWWKPVVELVLAAGLWILAYFIFLAVMTGFAALMGVEMDGEDSTNVLIMMVELGGIGLLIPTVMAAVMIAKGQTLASRWSSAGYLRWDTLGRSLVASCAVMIPMAVINAVLVASVEGCIHLVLGGQEMIALAVIICLVPFQAAAEELVFRGLIPQFVGHWFRSPWIAYLAPLPLLVVLHDHDAPGLTFIAVFTGCTALLTWYTGGLESAVALRIVNNLIVLGGTAVGLVPSSNQAHFPLGYVAVNSMFTVMCTLVLMSVYRQRKGAQTYTGEHEYPGTLC